MRFRFKEILIGLFFLGVTIGSCLGATQLEDGLTPEELGGLAASISNLPGRIEAIKLFYEPKAAQNSIALATYNDKNAWEISVYRHSTNSANYELIWSSGKLDDSFLVSSPNYLKVIWIESGQAIAFSGCARHACPDVFSVLLYVPLKQTAFVGKYVWGKTSYSSNLSDAGNSQYKTAIDRLIKDHLD